jgi:crotonobetainyl-CoA:carnitine CoA-transferase CaiB-like acyl-CoA transferase
MTARKPLEGYKVVDFSAVFAGPLCSRYLLDCGAEVIKVETPKVGDITRGVEGITRVFAHFNAGKRSIAIDLKSPDGQAIARQLITQADIVIENFRPGIMAKFGLDYASLKAERPDLIYCSISGFGQTGPMVNRAAYAPIVHAASGFDSVHGAGQGNADNRPLSWDIMVADIVTGTLAFGAVQSALLGKVRSGQGEHIDISMMEAMMSLIPAHLQQVQMEQPVAIGRFYPVKANDGFFMLCAVSDKNLEGLAQAINRPDLLTDARFVRGPRTSNFNQLVVEVEKWSAGRSAQECETVLNDNGVPCSMYQRPEDLFSHPQVVERNSFTRLSNDQLGSFLIQNMPVKFNQTETQASPWAAQLGEHTNLVLQESLGLNQDAIAALRLSGAVA